MNGRYTVNAQRGSEAEVSLNQLIKCNKWLNDDLSTNSPWCDLD